MKSKYIVLIQLLVMGETLNVGFKKTGFRYPNIQRDPLDIEALAAADQKVMVSLESASAEEKPDLIGSLQLPPLVGPFLESGQTKNVFFDILTDEENAELTIEASKLDLSKVNKNLTAENKKLKAEIELLQKKVAELEAATATKESSPKPKSKA